MYIYVHKKVGVQQTHGNRLHTHQQDCRVQEALFVHTNNVYNRVGGTG